MIKAITIKLSDSARLLFIYSISPFNDAPIHNTPQSHKLVCTAVLEIQIVGVLPDIKGQEGFEAAGDGVAGIGLL